MFGFPFLFTGCPRIKSIKRSSNFVTSAVYNNQIRGVGHCRNYKVEHKDDVKAFPLELLILVVEDCYIEEGD